MSGGTLLGQRVLSIGLHLLCSLLLYSNVLAFLTARAAKKANTTSVSIAILFALFPIHAEAIVIGEFRGELLATFFTLLALRMLQGLRTLSPWHILSLILLVGLAGGSKEVFVVILPSLLLVFFPLCEAWPKETTKRVAVVAVLFVVTMGWSLWLWAAMHRDSTAIYSYRLVLGSGVLPIDQHVILAARALIEGCAKMLGGVGLTTLRLMSRDGLVSSMGVGVAILVIASALGILGACFMRWGKWPGRWVGVFLSSIFLYYLIPSLNIGQEHHWYFPSIGAVIAMVSGTFQLSRRWFKNGYPIAQLFLGLLSLQCLFSLESRLLDFRTRESLLLSEFESHPESSSAIVGAAAILLQNPLFLDRVMELVNEAKQKELVDPDVFLVEFQFHLARRDIASAEKSLKNYQTFPYSGRKLARFYMELGAVLIDSEPTRARAFFEEARRLDPTNPIVTQYFETRKE